MGQVLFVCSGNYYRSRFAEILFTHLARERGLPWGAQSRGFRLSPGNVGPISVHTANACTELNLQFDADRWPMVLAESDLKSAERVIALKETEHRPMMRARFPDWENRIEYWEIHDIDVATPDVALRQLSAAVRELVGSLAPPRSHSRG